MHSSDPSALLLREFLAWVADRPRGYADTMAAWRTSCPRLQIWEDATEARLVQLEHASSGTRQGEALIALTDAGRAALAAVPA